MLMVIYDMCTILQSGNDYGLHTYCVQWLLTYWQGLLVKHTDWRLGTYNNRLNMGSLLLILVFLKWFLWFVFCKSLNSGLIMAIVVKSLYPWSILTSLQWVCRFPKIAEAMSGSMALLEPMKVNVLNITYLSWGLIQLIIHIAIHIWLYNCTCKMKELPLQFELQLWIGIVSFLIL